VLRRFDVDAPNTTPRLTRADAETSSPTGTAAPRRDCLAVLQESAEFRRVEVVEIDLVATTGGRLEWI
jgi:hypothetical protein